MRKIACSLLIVISTYCSRAQIKATIPEILPPSPEATAFIRAGLGKANLSTGAITTRIPLYELKVHDYTLPIALSYSSQGMRVDEASSRVGINWSLQAGGMITRTVRGKPDELAISNPGLPQDFWADNSTNYNYFSQAADGLSGIDTQRDEYYFSFNGYSGKYVINESKQAVCLSNENLKISAASGMGVVTITTPDGVKYFFGENEAYEKTLHFSMSTNNIYKASIKTALFLTRIELVNGATIYFDYGSINILVNTGISQTLTVGSNGVDQPCSGCGATNQSYETKMNGISYATKYLSTIYTSTGTFVTFTYENRPDQSGDNRLTLLSVTGNTQDIIKYKFDYYDRSDGTSGGALNYPAVIGRFFLTQISKAKPLQAEPDALQPVQWQQHYQFRYNDMQNAALPLTLEKDHYGFYNGIPGLLPTLGPNNEPDFSNRQPNPSLAMKGVLSAIVYPTGGVEEFFYGANTVPSYMKRETNVTIGISGADSGAPGTTSSTTMQTSPMPYAMRVKRDHVATLEIQSLRNPLYEGSVEPWPTQEVVTVRLLKGVYSRQIPDTVEISDSIPYTDEDLDSIPFIATVGSPVFSTTLRGYSSVREQVNLEAGFSYVLELTIKGGLNNAGNAVLYYDTASQDYTDYFDKVVSGVRLERMRYTDSVTGKSYSRYYKYTSLEDTTKSSGGGGGEPGYNVGTYREIYCNPENVFISEIAVCTGSMYLSNTQGSLFDSEGSHIYYSHVLESDDPNFINGGTEYIFNNSQKGKTTIQGRGTYGGVPDDAFGDTFITLTGILHETRQFNRQRQIVQEKTDEYEIVAGGMPPVYSVYANQQYEPVNVSNYSESMKSFTAAVYMYENQWRRLKSTTTRIYDSNQVANETKTDYVYGSSANIQPVEVVTTNSKGEVLKKVQTYPTDYFSDVLLTQMVSKNMIAFPVEEASYKGTQLLQKKQTIYRDWFGDGKVIRPDTIKIQESPAAPLHPAILYSSYDQRGNPQQVQKITDIAQTYLWGYDKQYPVAEVKNAGLSEVYYNSFEEGSEGSDDPEAKTGTKSHTGNYTFNFTLPQGTNRSFILTYWSYNGTGWALQSTPYSGGSMTLTGSKIDEIRIHPTNAQMTTYTYAPLIGMTSQTDANNRTTYYEYDGMGRLSLIRDQDGNIVKKYCYNYAGQVEDCGVISTAPLWQSTGLTQCKLCPQNSAYLSNLQQHQEKDNNVNSPGYGTTRWVDDGVSSSCVPQADWQNTGAVQCEVDLYDLNGNPLTYTGNQLKEQKDMNPCSPSYNTSRWVSNGQNCASCPKPANWQALTGWSCQTNSSGQNTGYQTRTEKDMESCSPTYNQTRTATQYNTTSCPLPYVCSTSNCGGDDRKCINGVCETGNLVVVSSVYQKVLVDGLYQWRWVCTRQYCFSDGTYSTYSEQSYQTTSCPVDFCTVPLE